MSKAVQFDSYGGIDVLEVRDVPCPVSGAGEVLVEVRAAGINPSEAVIRSGALHHLFPATFPSGQGSDLAGVVAELGPGVSGLSDEISYSQPVLYAHFGSREGILTAVAIEGFQELGLALEKARKRVKRGGTVESVAAAYLEFAASSPALYEVMFSLSLGVPFDDAATPPELRFAFSQLLELFQGQSSKSEVLSELFWASLHGIAELTRTKRFPRSRQKERVRALVELFSFRDEMAQVVKAR